MADPNNKNKAQYSEEYWQQEGGSKWAKYIDHAEASLGAFNKFLFDQANLSEGEVVLDVGCGGGPCSIEIAKRVSNKGSVTGLDISMPVLEIAKQRAEKISNLRFINSDAATSDLGAGVYDLVFSRFGVMFFSDPTSAFSNLRRALKSNGRLVFLCWRSMDDNPWMNVPVKAAFSVLPPQGPPPSPEEPGPFSMASSDKVKCILKDAGFHDISFQSVEIDMNLGAIDDAVDYFFKMGPAAAPLAEVDEELKRVAVQAMGDALKNFETSDGICPPAASWIVTANS